MTDEDGNVTVTPKTARLNLTTHRAKITLEWLRRNPGAILIGAILLVVGIVGSLFHPAAGGASSLLSFAAGLYWPTATREIR